MSFQSHRRSATRAFDCIYDPNYSLPSEREEKQASMTAVSSTSSIHIYPKFNQMFADKPKEERMDFRKKYVHFPQSACSDRSSQFSERLQGGENDPAKRKVPYTSLSPSECKNKPLGLFYFKPNTNVSVVNVKLADEQTKYGPEHFTTCMQHIKPPKRYEPTKTRGTQTLYRESSAQTLPYKPDIKQTIDEVAELELFKLSHILSGDGPPGLYEVEILERARKRWAFARALKHKLEQEMDENRRRMEIIKHKHILEAFEWQKWIEREEYIQECQMIRLEIVIQMFNSREKEMHETSKKRIELAYQRIDQKRKAALQKNEIDYMRQLRCLQLKRQSAPRNWRKENIAKELGDPSSEFYAPKMRYGVNPNRRHYEPIRKHFEPRIEDLNKAAINMRQLECPFAKLRRWAEPKQPYGEIETNFCSDKNLEKLYDSLKSLRLAQTKLKVSPKCLKVKNQAKSVADATPYARYTAVNVRKPLAIPKLPSLTQLPESAAVDTQPIAYLQKKQQQEQRIAQQEKEMKYMEKEDIEGLLLAYEGTTIGWLLRFLSEEMDRLREHRRLHFISMLAQKERWRREAAEAGLRQKENEMREMCEQLYQESSLVDHQVGKEYLDEVLMPNVRESADAKAIATTAELAEIIDQDIKRWLESFKLIQNPFNYNALRIMFRDLIAPDPIKCVEEYHKKVIVSKIVNTDILQRVFAKVTSFDIASKITNNLVNRLIDNDLYDLSDECDSDCDCGEYCICEPAEREARSIIRKLIRRTVPGKRYMDENQRIAHENVMDILHEAFGRIEGRGLFDPKNPHHKFDLFIAPSYINIFRKSLVAATDFRLSTNVIGVDGEVQIYRKFTLPTAITGSLKTDEYYEDDNEIDYINESVIGVKTISEPHIPTHLPFRGNLKTRSFINISKSVFEVDGNKSSSNASMLDALLEGKTLVETKPQPMTVDTENIMPAKLFNNIINDVYSKILLDENVNSDTSAIAEERADENEEAQALTEDTVNIEADIADNTEHDAAAIDENADNGENAEHGENLENGENAVDLDTDNVDNKYNADDDVNAGKDNADNEDNVDMDENADNANNTVDVDKTDNADISKHADRATPMISDAEPSVQMEDDELAMETEEQFAEVAVEHEEAEPAEFGEEMDEA